MTALYLRNEVADVNPGSNDERYLGLAPGTGLATAGANTATGPIGAGALAFQIASATVLWLTKGLNAVTIPAATVITFNLWVAESNAGANAGAECVLLRCGADGTPLTNVCSNSEAGVEMAVTTRAAQNWTTTASLTNIAAGERLGVFTYANDGGGTMVTGFTVSLGFNGPTAAADGDSWIDVAGVAISEQVVAAPTYLPRRMPLAV